MAERACAKAIAVGVVKRCTRASRRRAKSCQICLERICQLARAGGLVKNFPHLANAVADLIKIGYNINLRCGNAKAAQHIQDHRIGISPRHDQIRAHEEDFLCLPVVDWIGPRRLCHR